MNQGHVQCPACQSPMVLPQGMLPGTPVQCSMCGHQFTFGAQAPQQMVQPQQPVQPVHQQVPTADLGLTPVAQPNPLQQPAYQPVAQAPLKSPQFAQQPAKTGNSKLGLIIGISVGGGLTLLALVGVLVAVLLMFGNSSTDMVSGVTSVSSADANSNGMFGASVPYNDQPVYQPKSSGLRYIWNTGERFGVDFVYEAKLKNETSILEGRVSYVAIERPPNSVIPKMENGEGHGTGTGFVVRPDGYLVTCAHVVQGAVRVDVHLGTQVYQAKVLALDTKNDLALIRVPIDNLPHLPVADSDQVRLAEEVRAFGYPMTDRLGESIKITRGTISGINEQQGKKVFQLDVAANPGNSGGPLLNDKGHVVGAITSGLSGEISEITFAVTSNDVRQLLKRNSLKFDPSDASDPALSGPDLAEEVQKSVALLKVTTGAKGVGIAEKKVVSFKSSWRAYSKQHGVRQSKGGTEYETGNILIDSTGEVSYCDGNKALPAHLGLLAMVGLQPMADDDSNTWRSANITAVIEDVKLQIPSISYGRRYSPFGRPRTTSKNYQALHPAIEMARYEVVRTSGDIVDIKKTFELVTITHEESEKPYTRVDGTGTLRFDKRLGIPKSLDFSATLAVSSGANTTQVPVTLSFKSVNADQILKDEVAAREAAAKSRVAAAERAKQVAAERAANAIPLAPGLDKLDLGQ